MLLLHEQLLKGCARCRTTFTTLYMLLEHGHASPHTAARWDPPTNVFRLRLVCQVLCPTSRACVAGSAERPTCGACML